MSYSPIMVVLVDHRDGARVKMDPQKVRPDLDAALQPVILLDSSKPTVNGIHV